MLYCHLQHHNDTINKYGRRKSSLTKYLPLILLQGFEKGYSRFACERELETEQNWNILTPTPTAGNVVSFSFSRCLTGCPGLTLLGDGFLYCILSATSLVPKLHRGSRGSLRPGVVLPTRSRLSPSPTLLQLELELNCLTSVLTELYISSTPTWSPTRSLKSHVWSSSSGNNCHAVHRSLSSSASVYECTMGIFLARPISSANFRPRDFLS